MFMKRKTMGALSLAAVMTASLLGGCAMPGIDSGETGGAQQSQAGTAAPTQAETNADGTVTIRVVDWSDGSIQQREKFHKEFMEKHPNINIEYTMLTVDQFKNTIVTMIKSGEGPDLFPIPVGMTLNTALEENWFQPLNPYVSEEFKSQFDPKSFEEGVTHKGEDWYTITEIMPTIQCLFFYNKDVLEQAGISEVPHTYSEFVNACRTITEQSGGQVYGLIDGGKQLNRLDVLARSLAAAAGGKIGATQKVLTDQGRAPYDSDAMKQAMGMLAQLVKDGSVYPDTVNISAPEAREMFAQGQAGFLCQGMWCIAQWGENYPDLNYGVMAVPVPDGMTNTYVQKGELSPWMGLYSQSQHPKEAAEYLMALYSEEYGYQSGCVEDGTFVSVIPSVNEKHMKNQNMKDYYTIADETSKVVPAATMRDEKAYDFYTEVKDIQPSLGAIVQGILSRSITDYESELTKLSDASSAEWKRASEAVGLDFDVFEFPNWDVTRDYTAEDYEALK